MKIDSTHKKPMGIQNRLSSYFKDWLYLYLLTSLLYDKSFPVKYFMYVQILQMRIDLFTAKKPSFLFIAMSSLVINE